MLGPVVGQLIYSVTSYNFGLTFYIFSVFIAPFMILAWVALPNSLNDRQQGGTPTVAHGEGGFIAESKDAKQDNTNFEYSYIKILKNFRVVLSLLSAVVILVLTLFFDGIVGPRFVHIGIGKDAIGYLFGG